MIAGLALAAGMAFAKEGVQDPTVKARMDLMGTIAMNTKILGDMAGGKTAFDAAAAEAAKTALAAAAAEIPAKFEPQATDPVSEAAPAIWTSWEDYLVKAQALVTAAEAIDVSSADTIGAGMGAVGGTCRACHSAYQN
jgi:cytochrome c556